MNPLPLSFAIISAEAAPWFIGPAKLTVSAPDGVTHCPGISCRR
ncbi:hypothetical protein [Paracoccus sp. (in: a-proteobacteria)]